jgi:hypothetical protein
MSIASIFGVFMSSSLAICPKVGIMDKKVPLFEYEISHCRKPQAVDVDWHGRAAAEQERYQLSQKCI